MTINGLCDCCKQKANVPEVMDKNFAVSELNIIYQIMLHS